MAVTKKSINGVSVSFGNTPQAKDDIFTATTAGINEDSNSIVYLDVMANDLGGNAKLLYSLDDTISAAATTIYHAPADLLNQDAIGAVNKSKFGAEISITSDGKVAYNMNTAAFRSEFQSLAEGVTGYDTFTYAIRLGNGTLSWSTATVEIAGRNDAPVVSAQAANATEGGSSVTVNALATASDVDAGTTLKVIDMPVTLPAGVTYAEETRSFRLDPCNAAYDHLAQGATAQVVVSYAVSDGITSTPTSITYTITGTNDGPVAVADVAAGTENQTLTIDVLANDTDLDDGHLFTLNAASAPSGKGAAVVVANQLQFNPGTDFDHLAAGATEQVTLNYEMQDEQGAISTSTVEVTITGTNDGPTVAAPLTSATDEDKGPYTIDLLADAADVDNGSQLRAGSVIEADGKGGWSVAGNTVTINPAFYEKMNTGEHETLYLNYQVIDEHGASVEQSLTVSIAGITDAPSLLVATSAGAHANEVRLNITSQPANTERVDLNFGNLPGGAIVLDQQGKDVSTGVDNYAGTHSFTVVLPENQDVHQDLSITATGVIGNPEYLIANANFDSGVIGQSVQVIDLSYDVSSSTEMLTFDSNNQNMWGDFNGYIGWHEYIPFIGGAPVEWDAQAEEWNDVAGGGDYWRSGEFKLVDVSLDSEDIYAEALKVVKAPLDLAKAGQTEAANLVTAAKTWDTNAGAKYNMVNNVVNAWIAFDVPNAAYVGAKAAYDGAKWVFDQAQVVFDGAKAAFDWLGNEYNRLHNEWVVADQAMLNAPIIGIFGEHVGAAIGLPLYDPIKTAVAVAAKGIEVAAWLAYEAGMPIYNTALSIYNGAKDVFAPFEQDLNYWKGFNDSAYNNAISLENAMHNAGYYTDRAHAEGDAVTIIESGLALAEHGLAEAAVIGAEATKLAADIAVVLPQEAYNLAHDALDVVNFGADLQVQADIFAQAGLQVDFDLDLGSVDTHIDYQLTSMTQYNQTTDMLAITPLMTNVTTGDTVAFDTISPNVKFHAAILYDVGADLDLSVDGNLTVAGQPVLDLTPGTTAPIHISTTISTSAIPELPEGVPTSPVLEMIENMTPGELELIDFDSARDLGGPFEVPGINYLLGLVGADDILTIELAFPTVQTEGVAEDYSQAYFTEGGLVGVDFSEITDSLFNLLQAKIDYSPEMKQLAHISGNLMDNLTFDQLVNNALKAFSATILDTLDGQSEAVPVFLIDTTDETSTSLLHVNTFPDNLSTINDDTASFGFFAGYGESDPVVKVSVDLDQAYAFIVNEITKAIIDAVAAGTTVAATNAIPTINPYDLSLGMEEICEIFELPKEIADVINFEIGFQAADLDVHDAVDFSQEFTLSIDDMSYLVTLEDGFKSTFTANGAGNLQIENASSHDANGDGVMGYSLDIVPTAMFSNDTEIGLSMGYTFDLLKAELSAGIKLPLADLLKIPGLPDIDIPAIDIGVGPLLRIEGDLDLVDVDVFESRFALDVGSSSADELRPIGIDDTTMWMMAA